MWPGAVEARYRRSECRQRDGRVLELGECDVDRTVELRVDPGRVVLRAVLHDDVRIGPVVLDAPPDVAEPEAELGLRRNGAVDERVPRPDSDDASPRALADELAEAEQLEHVTEHVAVRASELVGDRDARTEHGIVRVRP